MSIDALRREEINHEHDLPLWPLPFARSALPFLLWPESAALLDEATSALDLRNEAIMYEALAAVEGVTFVSVGHRPSLLRFHKSRLRLYGAEQTPSYQLESIDTQEDGIP